MKAWRFYGFNDMRLDEVPDPVRREGHVIAEILCVQPSVTEAQLAYGIRCDGFVTLAYEQIKRRLETEAPIRLFGHEFCARIVESDRDSQFRPGDRVAARAKLPCGACSLCLSERGKRLPAGSDYRFSAARLLLRVRRPARNRFDESG